MAKIYDGSINGISYDFVNLQKNLGLCFVDDKNYKLSGDIFTLFLGNCTPDRLEKLFKTIGLKPLFDDETGRNQLIRKWAQNAGVREARNRAEEGLSEEIKRRNQIAHGTANLQVLASDVVQAAEFFEALASAVEAKARGAVS